MFKYFRPLLKPLLAALAGLSLGPAYAVPALDSEANATGITFNPALLPGGAKGVDLSRFEHGNLTPPGTYPVDIMVNDRWMARERVSFEGDDAVRGAQPCFSQQLLVLMNVNLEHPGVQPPVAQSCTPLGAIIPGASASFDFSAQQLSISIPQIYLRRSARGYVPPELWDSGVTSGILNYSTNLYSSRSQGRTTDQANAGLMAGVTLGNWTLRHRSSANWSRGPYGSTQSWQNIANYGSRAVPALRSMLTVGDASTAGQIFDSVSFRGIQLASDDRMLPDSQRGYAPVVRGVAESNAKVEVRQNGYVIYQTTVAPGPFEINDLYPTGYGGDLDVSVTEADGRVRRFSVPYAAVPLSLRPGVTRFSVTSGRLRDTSLHTKPMIFQGVVQHGLNNLLTAYGGVLYADDYYALAPGIALNTRMGAFGLDVTHARARIGGQPEQTGQSWRLSYSKLLAETGTSFSLAAYRYSTSGYLSLRDALALTDILRRQDNGVGQLWRQRNRLDVSFNQRLGDRWGAVYLTGSTLQYWNQGGRNTQYQLGYSNNVGRLTYSLSAGRSRDMAGRSDTQYYLTLSIPLGRVESPMSVSSSIGRSGGQMQSQLLLSGAAGDAQQYNYSLGGGHNDSGNTLNLNGQYRGSQGILNAGYAQGPSYRQTSLGASGALIVHPGGISAAQTLGDTVAIVHAPGAEGARVASAVGVTVDSRGYAVVPYMTPYEMNTVNLDPQGTSLDVELKSTSQKVAPRAGGVVMLDFDTIVGRSALIEARQPDGAALPFGADVFDANDQSIGLVGQQSRIYVRGLQERGEIVVKWGKLPSQQCRIAYEMPPKPDKQALSASLVQLSGICEPQEDGAAAREAGTAMAPRQERTQ